MAGFFLRKSRVVEEPVPVAISSISGSAGDMLALGAGSTTWAKAAATTEHWQRKAVAVEPYTTNDTEVLVIEVQPGQVWEAESANNSDAADNGDRMLLTDENTVNNTGTDNTSEEACFIQDGVLGAAADKRILGTIVYGTGVNPDAA